MLKRVDNSRSGRLLCQEGSSSLVRLSLGLKEDAVGLAINEFYERNVPEEMRADRKRLQKRSSQARYRCLLLSNWALMPLRNSVTQCSQVSGAGESSCPVNLV